MYGSAEIPGVKRSCWCGAKTLVALGIIIFGFFMIYLTVLPESKAALKPIIDDTFPECNDIRLKTPDYRIPTFHIFTNPGSKLLVSNVRINNNIETLEPAVLCSKISMERYYIKISKRGQLTSTFAKKQFDVKPVSEFGDHMAVNFFGLATSKSWVLNGPFIDPSFVRNAVSFHIHNSIGGKSPHLQYINVFINNVDQGLYFLVPKPNAAFIGKENIDHWVKGDYPCLDNDNCVQSTNMSFIIGEAGGESADSASALLHRLDRETQKINLLGRMHNPTPFTMETNLASFMDLQSFARYFIVEEIAKNFDGYVKSNKMYIKDGKLFHASVWDYHLGYHFACAEFMYTNHFGEPNTGEVGWNADNVRDIYFDGTNGWVGVDNFRILWTRLFHIPEFSSVFKTEWKRLRLTVLRTEVLLDYIDKQTFPIQWAAYRDISIWSNTFRCGIADCCYPEASADFFDSVYHVKEWLVNRMAWIDENIDDITDHLTPLHS